MESAVLGGSRREVLRASHLLTAEDRRLQLAPCSDFLLLSWLGYGACLDERIPYHDLPNEEATPMRDKKRRFIEILRIELEDLKEHIDELIAQSKDAFEGRELSKRVYLENLAVLGNELLGVGTFSHILDELDIDDFDTLEAMIQHLEQKFTAEVESCGLAPAINVFVKRKIDKVARFVEI